MEPQKRSELMKRSVDSLERLFAVVVALSITVAIQKILFDSNGNLHKWYDKTTNEYVLYNVLMGYLPAFLAFIVTVVPFYHGMNRHWDRIYVERDVPPAKEGFLVIDFFVFFLESCLLVAFASLVNLHDYAFIVLMLLLTVDMLWAFVTHVIHYGEIKPSTIRWGIINVITVSALGLCYFSNLFTVGVKRNWALFIVAGARTIIDYKVCWRFYFPKQTT